MGTNKRSEKSRLQSSNNCYTEGFEVKRRFIFTKQLTSCFNLNFRYLEAFFWTQRTAAVVKTLKTLTKINLNYNKWQYIKLSSFKKWSLLHILSDIKDKGWWEEKLSEKQQDQKLSTAVIDKSFNDFYFIDLLFKISQKCLKIVKNMSIKTSRDSRAFKHLVKSEQQIQTTLKTQEQNPENLFDKLFSLDYFLSSSQIIRLLIHCTDTDMTCKLVYQLCNL